MLKVGKYYRIVNSVDWKFFIFLKGKNAKNVFKVRGIVLFKDLTSIPIKKFFWTSFYKVIEEITEEEFEVAKLLYDNQIKEK